MSWHKRWMDLAALVATWSKDQSRKTSAVIVDDRNILVSIGWNGFPRDVNDKATPNDKIAARYERPAKYQWTEHAERNAIYNAAANGYKLRGCYMYIPWYPCADCARGIIQSGISKLFCVKPDWHDERWGADFLMVDEMLREAGVQVEFIEGYSPINVEQTA